MHIKIMKLQKKHIENLKIAEFEKNIPMNIDDNKDDVSSDSSDNNNNETKEPKINWKKKFAEAQTEEEFNKVLDEKIRLSRKIEETECLFCNSKGQTFEEKMEHMTTEHSFFVPDVEYLSDLRGLIKYLEEKIAIGNTCIFCERMFHSLEAIRKHMLAKGHTKISYEEGPDLEISNFYDFSSILDDDNENENGNNENNNNDNDNENENEVGKNVTEVEVIMDETIILTKSSDMKDFFKTNEKMVIGCFETIGNEDYLNFKNISNSMIESPSFATENYFNGEVLKFIYINDNKCRHTIKRFTGISIFKNDVVYCINKRCYEYNPKDLIDFNKFEEFMESKNMPLVTSYDPKEKDTYRQWKIPMIIYLNNDEEKAKKNVKTFISDIAKEYRKEFFFFVTNENDFDIDMADEPTDNNVFIYAPHFQTLYSIQEILDPEDVIDKVSIEFFIKQYKMNLLTPKMVIQDFEELWDYEDFVVNSIPKYYYPNVLNPLRDSLVMFYKEDCPYSQELLKTFVKLGKKIR